MLGSIRSIWGIHSSRTCGGENDAIFADAVNTWNIIVLYQREGCVLIDTVGARRCPQGCVAVVTFKGAIRWAMYEFG